MVLSWRLFETFAVCPDSIQRPSFDRQEVLFVADRVLLERRDPGREVSRDHLFKL
jgi:hypothetical protein